MILPLIATLLMSPQSCDPIPDLDPPCGCGGQWFGSVIGSPPDGVAPYFPWYGMRTSYSSNAGEIGNVIVFADRHDCCCTAPIDVATDVIWTWYTISPSHNAQCIGNDAWSAINFPSYITFRIKSPTIEGCGETTPQVAIEILTVPNDPGLVGATVFRQSFIDRDADAVMDRGGEGHAITFFSPSSERHIPPGGPEGDLCERVRQSYLKVVR